MAYKAIDLHCDSVFSLMEGKNLLEAVEGVHVDLPRMRKGRVGLQVFAAYLSPSIDASKAFSSAMEKLDLIDAFAMSSELMAQVETAAELKAILALEKTGIMAAVENGLAIEESLEKLELLRRRKVRILTLVHSKHMSWVASCTGTEPFEGGGRGLNAFGEKVVDAMNYLGIIPDVSHCSEAAFWDTLKRSKKPIVASHSCAYSLSAHVRNLKDDQLKALGDSGGLVGINFASSFLSEPYRLQHPMKTLTLPKDEEKPPTQDTEPVTVPQSIVADHIDYIVKIAGEDCVGLGSDFDGVPATPEGVTGSDYYPQLEAELRSRGYTEKCIEKIFNANFVRLLEEWDK
jgi:membrane dipeptidase